MSYAIRLKGFRLKGNKIERDPKRLDVSARLRLKTSKKVRVRRGRLR